MKSHNLDPLFALIPGLSGAPGRLTDFAPLAEASSGFRTVTIADRAAAALADSGPLAAAGWLLTAAVGTVAFLTVLALVLIYAERKVAAHFQCRLGPMRVGWHGTLQTIADALKLLLKEDLVPAGADRMLHLIAPGFCIVGTVLLLAMLPASPVVHVMDLSIGIVYVAAVSGFGVLGVLIGGWSSNNKWSLIGAIRAGAQIISYELSAVLALLVVVMFAGTLSLGGVVASQADGWWIWRGHLVTVTAFTVFMIASVAELNRTPFDMAEGESELTAGFHTEYSGMRFALFFLAEFLNMFVASAVAATLFLGGWMPFHLPGAPGFNAVMDLIPPGLWFAGKTGALIFMMMWFRWTFPRLRVDQLMRLEWKVLLPVGIVNLLVATVVIVMKWYAGA